MKKFSFGNKAYKLNFVIDEDKIYLYDDDNLESLTPEQQRELKHNSVICEVQISVLLLRMHRQAEVNFLHQPHYRLKYA